jgi:hypothetical protein|tara:strand:- start:683 stop:961 length:279 start_codon:yes stop_codon:yes gene_type:complete
MFILTIEGKEKEGAYSVANELGEKVLYIFEEEDDATRYAMMLEDEGYPDMTLLDIEDEVIIKTCEQHGYHYTIITPNDIVIPPDRDLKNDLI